MKLILGILLLCFTLAPTFAHPGNTAADGCHYCRTNCDEWGVAWNVRHCHNTYVAPTYNYSSNTKSTDTDNDWLGWIAGIGGIGAIIYTVNKKKN